MFSENSVSGSLFQIVKAVLFSLLFAVVFVLLLTIPAYFAEWSDGLIKTLCQSGKALCVLLGCIFCIKGEKGWLKGLIAGVLFSMLSCFLFNAVSKTETTAFLFVEISFGAVAGLLSGIVAVNVGR